MVRACSGSLPRVQLTGAQAFIREIGGHGGESRIERAAGRARISSASASGRKIDLSRLDFATNARGASARYLRTLFFTPFALSLSKRSESTVWNHQGERGKAAIRAESRDFMRKKFVGNLRISPLFGQVILMATQIISDWIHQEPKGRLVAS